MKPIIMTPSMERVSWFVLMNLSPSLRSPQMLLKEMSGLPSVRRGKAIVNINIAETRKVNASTMNANSCWKFACEVIRDMNGRVLYMSAARPSMTVAIMAVSYTHLRAHETRHDLVCRLLLEKKKKLSQKKKKTMRTQHIITNYAKRKNKT